MGSERPKVKLLSEDALVELELYARVEWIDRPGNELPTLVALARWARKARVWIEKKARHANGCTLVGNKDCSCGMYALRNEIEEPTP